MTLFVIGQLNFGTVEWATLFLVLICIYFWLTKGSSSIIIFSTLAVTIGSIPQLFDAYKDPFDIYLLPCFGFVVASIISIIAGKDWSIKERLYATARALIYATVIILAMRKFF